MPLEETEGMPEKLCGVLLFYIIAGGAGTHGKECEDEFQHSFVCSGGRAQY